MLRIEEFSDDEFGIVKIIDTSNEYDLYESIFIGGNALGKSRLIVKLIQSFRHISNYLEKGEVLGSPFAVKYAFDSDRYIFSFKDGGVKMFKNDIEVKTIPTPNTILAISTTYNDKFPFSDTSNNDADYHYCGLRETSNASWISTLTRYTLDNLLYIISDAEKQDSLGNVFDELGLEHNIVISYKIKRKKEISFDNFSNLIFSGGESTFYHRSKKYYELTPHNVEDMFKLYKQMMNSRNADFLQLSLRDSEVSSVLIDNLDLLRKSKLISHIEIKIQKRIFNSKHFNFSSGSSGETLLLYTLTSILRHAKNNSLIFIDEPEVSLHPTWQVKYLSILRSILKTINGCHVLIATHCHFLVSDLKETNGSVVTFNFINGVRTIELLGNSTYAWSPESILYNVFNVRTVGNVYFDKELSTALKISSAYELTTFKRKKLESYVEKFNTLVFDELDPLNKIISALSNRLKND